jgi:hypothetical protein
MIKLRKREDRGHFDHGCWTLGIRSHSAAIAILSRWVSARCA